MISLAMNSVCKASPERAFRVIEASVVASLGVDGDDESDSAKSLRTGASWDIRRTAKGGQSIEHCRIVAFDPPKRLCYELSGGARAFSLDFQVAASGSGDVSGTQITCKGDFEARRKLLRLLSPILRLEVKRLLKMHLDNIVAWAETPAGCPPPPLKRRGLWLRPQSYYQGLLEASAPGLHARAAELLTQHISPCDGVLDLAAGSGAWLKRLQDKGFRDVSAVELNAASYYLPDVPARQHDLNNSFSQQFQHKFQLITALEIMEHLDSPRHFAKEIHSLLADDGHALITVPNIGHWAGRLLFLRRGEHIYFEESDYAQRHISPVTDLHMKILFRETGFRVIDSISAGCSEGPLKSFCVAPVALLFRLLCGRQTRGEVSVYLVAKDKPDSDHIGRDSHYGARLAA